MEKEETIRIFLNKKEMTIRKGLSILELLDSLGKKPEGIAFAIENKVVKRQDWANTQLQDEAQVTMIKAVCGG